MDRDGYIHIYSLVSIRNSANDVNTTWGIDAVDGAKITFGVDTGNVKEVDLSSYLCLRSDRPH